MSTIKIFVTHTPNKNDFLVDNPLFVDVIAGGAYQTKPVREGMVTDSTGDNISLKNRSYCELTTQYWAWKNEEADYYGFCHYRRFLTLSDRKFREEQVTDRGQVNAMILNKETAEHYGLTDADGMKAFVEGYDCILPVRQDLSILPTPKGKQDNVYKHFAGHDRLFMHAPDIRVMYDIIREKYPEYAQSAKEYLSQKTFWGFNCYILKKEYFNRLCEFEFGVLEEAEKRLDTRLYNRQASRVFGFLGEMLSCIFFHHLQRTVRGFRTRECRLIYFDFTDDVRLPGRSAPDSVPILLTIPAKLPGFLLELPVLSLIRSMSPDRRYDLTICHFNMPKDFRDHFAKVCAEVPNLSLSFYDMSLQVKLFSDLRLKTEELRLLIPWVFQDLDRALVVSWNSVFLSDPAWTADADLQGCLIAGSPDVLKIGRIFDVKPDFENSMREHSKLTHFEDIIGTDALIMDLRRIREAYPRKYVCCRKFPQHPVGYTVLMNELYGSRALTLQPVLTRYYTENAEEKQCIAQVPLYLYNAYTESEGTETVRTFDPHVMLDLSGSEFSVYLWKLLRDSDYRELFTGLYSRRSVFLTDTDPWFFRKLQGGLQCLEDHGVAYTMGYSVKKATRAAGALLKRKR